MDSWLTLALPGAVAYASSLLGDRGRGQDVVQDCVCRLLGHAARYDLPRDGRKLLFRSITIACLNQKARDRRTLSLEDLGRVHPADEASEIADAQVPDPSEIAMAEELRQAIHAGLQSLPLRQRSALELASLGYDTTEIAEMLELRSDHVRVLLSRARYALAALLNRKFSEGFVV
ncbi:MAG: RNA polymerase sigma factor [Pirellulales bacterium]